MTNEWDEVLEQASGITTEQLDEAIAKYNELREVHQEIDLKKKAAYAEMAKQEQQVVKLLQSAGKTKYVVEGIGTAYFVNKYLVTTPKTIEDKKAFFKYLEDTFGTVFLYDKLSVHSASLNKIYNDALEAKKDNGEDISLFSIPGLQPPQVHTSLNFRKEKVK